MSDTGALPEDVQRMISALLKEAGCQETEWGMEDGDYHFLRDTAKLLEREAIAHLRVQQERDEAVNDLLLHCACTDDGKGQRHECQYHIQLRTELEEFKAERMPDGWKCRDYGECISSLRAIAELGVGVARLRTELEQVKQERDDVQQTLVRERELDNEIVKRAERAESDLSALRASREQLVQLVAKWRAVISRPAVTGPLTVVFDNTLRMAADDVSALLSSPPGPQA